MEIIATYVSVFITLAHTNSIEIIVTLGGASVAA